MNMWKLYSIIAIIIIGLVVIPLIVYGDDNESDLGLCLRHFQRYCDKIDIERTMDQLLQRAREWNLNHSAYGQQTECFSDINDFFREKIKHINDTDITIVFPCPELNRSQIPEDESGK
ncbi:hypothetical protein [Glutamicibacter sp.]|jgi:hypothetical protein|uniref:hypothetical protein n=1 Tax=Glutamicibacter sp. TaxID=1931995 RepID=UPI002B47925D|nr:hypothetical protein [Glutamicibacter sp.]HJX79174.1 hypothetical protein [Glutamicibacter sp.]